MLAYFEAMLKEPDVTLFLHGACHVFALALHERFGYPIIVLCSLQAAHRPNATHVYCRLGATGSVDVVGIAPEQIALTELGWSGPHFRPIEVLPEAIEGCQSMTGGDGLYAHPAFLRATRARAQARITEYRDYYSGRNLTAIPGASRTQRASPREIEQLFE
jgi:hypothetical protein